MVTRVAVTTGAPASATAFSPTLPAHVPGDRLVLVVTGKYNTTTVPTINQGWTLVGSGTGGTGSTGNDTGITFWAAYAKDALSGAEAAPTVTPGATAPNSWEWVCASHRPGAGKRFKDAIGANAAWVKPGSDVNTASPLTQTTTAWTGIEPTDGDALFAVGVIPTDTGTALGATTLTSTGLSGGTVTAATTQYVENSLGQDTAAVWAGWTGFTGTSSAGLAVSFIVTSASNHSGSIIAVSLREETDPTPIQLHYDENSGTEVTSDTSGSFTPQANAKVYVGVWSQSTGANTIATPVDSAGTLTWTKILDLGPTGSFNARFSLWESSDTGASPASRTVTVATATGTAAMVYSIWSVAGRTRKQMSAGSIGTGSTRNTGTLAAAAATGNVVAVFAGHNRDTATYIPTPTGWTALYRAVAGGVFYEIEALFYRTDFTGTSETIDTTSDAANDAAAVIIEWEVSGGPPPVTEFDGWGLPI